MNKLPSVESNKIIKRLLKTGFDYAPIKGKGSHIALVRVGDNGEKYLVIIPSIPDRIHVNSLSPTYVSRRIFQDPPSKPISIPTTQY